MSRVESSEGRILMASVFRDLRRREEPASRGKAHDRAQIAADVDAYLERGGQIRTCADGESMQRVVTEGRRQQLQAKAAHARRYRRFERARD